MSFLSIIKSNAVIKKEPHWLLIPRGQVRPKSLVRFFIGQYFLKKETDTVMLIKKVMVHFLIINSQTSSR